MEEKQKRSGSSPARQIDASARLEQNQLAAGRTTPVLYPFQSAHSLQAVV